MSNSFGRYSAEQKRNRTETPQTRMTPGRTDEVKNSAGGFTFKVDDKTRLERFLMLGSDKGSYYASERKLTGENVKFVNEMVNKNERLVVDTTVDISVNGRAAKNSPALFTMATVMAKGKDKAYARAALPKVARTPTHLFEYAQYIDDLAGWGRAKRQSVADWYESKDVDRLAYGVVKYRQRNGWTHRDLFRLAHPKNVDESIVKFVLNGTVGVDAPNVIEGFAKVQAAKNVDDVLRALNDYPVLPWEAIPTQFLKEAKVWQTLFYQGSIPQTALLRNVKRFAKIGAFKDMMFAGEVAKRLADTEQIRKGRVHPVAYLNALYIYTKGELIREKNSYWSSSTRRKDWDTNPKIAGALEDGFNNAFGNVVPSNKRTMVSIDTSASMTWEGPAGLVGLDCREAAAAMAMVLVRTEPYVTVNAFSTSLTDAGISDRDSLETVMRKIDRMPAGGTDCAQPMLHAAKHGIDVDTFTVWTDNETWAGRVKPYQALKQYRDKTGLQSRLAVVGMVANDFTIADPTDSGMLDFTGFDSGALRVLADFSAGRM